MDLIQKQKWSISLFISGRLEFIQDEGDASHTLVDLDGLGGQANSYHIHLVPIQPQLEFPCTGDAIGAHFAPYNFDPSTSPKPSVGTPDQVKDIPSISFFFKRPNSASSCFFSFFSHIVWKNIAQIWL